MELKLNDRAVKTPVWIMPGQAEDSVTIHLGYGRKLAGHVGNSVGFNAYQLRASNAIGMLPDYQYYKSESESLYDFYYSGTSFDGRSRYCSISFLGGIFESSTRHEEHEKLPSSIRLTNMKAMHGEWQSI